MSKFKIGDKVVRTDDDNSSIKKGEKVTISEINGSGWLSVKEVPNLPYAFCEDYFELYKEPEMKFNPMPELKTGMRVSLRNGDTFIFIKEFNRFFKEPKFLDYHHNESTGRHYTDGCTSYLDIVKVWQGNNKNLSLNESELGKLLWEYVEPVVEKTEADLLRQELSILKNKLRELGEEE